MAVRKDLPNRNRGRATLMPVHFPSESGPPAATPHGRRRLRASMFPNARFSALGIPFHATRNPGAGQGFTDLAAVVQLRLRVPLGLQTLAVKSRLLPGEKCWRTATRCASVAAHPFKCRVRSAECGFRNGGGAHVRLWDASLCTPHSEIRTSEAPVAQIMRARRLERRGCR